MRLSLGFLSFTLLNSLLLAAFIDGKYHLAGLLLALSAANLIVLTLVCQKINIQK